MLMAENERAEKEREEKEKDRQFELERLTLECPRKLPTVQSHWGQNHWGQNDPINLMHYMLQIML